MYPSANKQSGPTVSITILSIVRYTSYYLKKSDLENTLKSIHTGLDNTSKVINNNINTLLAKLLGKYDKQDAKLDNQYDKLEYINAQIATHDAQIYKKVTEFLTKFLTYEDLLEKISINKIIIFDTAIK